MNDRQLRYALAVWREGSFSRAAHRLNISQPSVSEQVQRLEKELGFALFARTGRGVEPTYKGRAFLHHAEQAMSGIIGLVDTARHLRGGPRGSFAVGFSTGIAQQLVPTVMDGLASVLPTTEIEVVTATTRRVQRLVHEERLDVGLAIEADPRSVPPNLVRRRLGLMALAVAVPPSHPLAAAGRPVPLVAVADERLIMNELDVGYGQFLRAIFADHGARPNITAVADAIDTIKLMVRANAGIAILPRAAVANEVALGQLVMLALEPSCDVPVTIVRRDQPPPANSPLPMLLRHLAARPLAARPLPGRSLAGRPLPGRPLA